MKVSDFDYELPKELIAQSPIEGRSGSKMMCLNLKGEITHQNFFNLPSLLKKDDVLILNDTKVIPARLLGKRDTGAHIEIFLLKPIEGDIWEVLIKNVRRLKIGEVITVATELRVKLLEKALNEGNTHKVELIYDKNKSIYEILDFVGKIPLPPYISREADDKDKEIYQTVFANKPESSAAPTAGLHFTKEILEEIEAKGVHIAYVTLVVGLGTFLPVKCENIEEHKMHYESYEIQENTAKLINEAKGDIVAVGTTVTRCLEATHAKHGKIIPCKDETNIFIYPPKKLKVINKLLTNFHLPKSTLIMLVSAFMGRENILNAYKTAVDEKYRFFSYGDCMFLDGTQSFQ